MFDILNNWLKGENLETPKNISSDVEESKLTEIINRSTVAKKVYGSPQSMFGEGYQFFIGDEKSERRNLMCTNMDTLLYELKKEITKQPLLGRVIRNISKGVLKNGYTFKSPNRNNLKKEQQVLNRFNEIIQNTSYEELEFIQEILSNLIKYSNAFIVPIRDENKKLSQALVVQNQGWSVKTHIGTSHATEYWFEPIGYNGEKLQKKAYKTDYDVWHFAFNKESDEIFGMPIWCSVIPTIRKYNYLISASIDSYSDQSLERTIYGVGVTKNGGIKAVTPEAFQFVQEQLANGQDDIIADMPIDVNTISKTYTSPDKILDVLSLQVIAGLYTSESQLGKSGAGRQDAETQENNTNAIIEDFQSALENLLNKTIVREICKELFGDNKGDNNIKIRFTESFNTRERKEKHAIYKFQGGVIDLDEARNECNYYTPLNAKKTFNALYNQSEIDGSVENSNNPSNQHTSGTGTTKKSTKQ
jgi:hypothetical protein